MTMDTRTPQNTPTVHVSADSNGNPSFGYAPAQGQWVPPPFPQPPFQPPFQPPIMDPQKQANQLRRREYNQMGYALFLQFGLSLVLTFAFVFTVTFWQIFSEIFRTGTINFTPDLSNPYAMYPPWLIPVATLVAMLAANLIPVLLFSNRLSLSITDMLRPKTTTIWVVLGGAAVCLSLNYGASFIMQLFNDLLSQVNVELTTPDIALTYDGLGNAAMLIYAVIIAPITEELLFRGLILRTFQRTGRTFAIVASSMLFALIHGNFIQSIPTFFIGLVLGYVTMRCGSVLPAILIHLVNNGYVMLLDELGNFLGDAVSYVEIGVLVIAVAAAIVVLWRERKQFALLSQRKAPKGSTGLLFSSWAVLLNVVFYVGISFLFVQILPVTLSF